ncbi:hypothetical protein PMSD_25245 [Paenibacillus macquariensis subsp. defensor]|nr:hypothetical protein PMSD_25245 [Paenibacillus macquariensis subsp. defensor]
MNSGEKSWVEDIAIIGIAAQFPGAPNIHMFWDNLINEVDCIREIPPQRRADVEGYLRVQKKLSDNNEFSKMGYLTNIDQFDHQFFKMSPVEANTMDPSQRIFLETVWHAIEDAGYGNGLLKGSDTGVFVGFSEEKFCNYAQMLYEVSPEQIHAALPGNVNAGIASRVAYILDLHGPNMVINTACSSSLVAVQMACQSLLAKESDMAIAGGIHIRLLPVHVEGSLIESQDGLTRTFDQSSAGTGVGEGSAAVVLKSLRQAIKDRDNIYGVIKGGAITQNGNSIGITAPNADAQSMVIKKAWERAGIDPETVSYIEAHGTATRLGDPIEIDGIQKAFRSCTDKKQFCAIGSVKSNIGHTDSVSGLAGLIKTVLMLGNKKIPPTLHFQEPNNEIPFHQSPVYIADQLADWTVSGFPRRAGVSSFGLSGTNCHIILEEFIPSDTTPLEEDRESACIFTLSAHTEYGLRCMIQDYIVWLENENNNEIRLLDICQTANTARGHYSRRVALLVLNKRELLDKIRILNDMDTIKENKKLGIFYNEHYVVSQFKQELQPKEVLRSTVRKLSKDTENRIEHYCLFRDDSSLLEIMEMYVDGAEINWCNLYPLGSFQKVRLPGYPFLPTRCWLDLPHTTKEFYETAWLPVDHFLSVQRTFSPKRFVVLGSIGDFNDRIINHLKDAGHQIIKVSYGTSYQMIDPFHYIIGNELAHYRLLLRSLEEQGAYILLQLALDRNMDVTNEETMNLQKQAEEILRLFRITQALAENKTGAECTLLLLTALGFQVLPNDKVHAEYSAAVGFSKVVSQEFDNINVRCIDLDYDTSLDSILEEILHGEASLVAYRNGMRFMEAIRKRDISQWNAIPNPVREGGVYIVTGGLGGMGLAIARYLAEHKPTTLILVNRTAFPDRKEWGNLLKENKDVKLSGKIKAIHEIERLGSEIVCMAADVSDYASMQKLTREIRDKFGTINGVVHGAGVAGNGFIYNKKEEQLKEVLSGKIMGAVILDQLTQKDDLDFFVMFSAISSLTGLPGQSDYVAANVFLDSFSCMRNQIGKNTLCIKWPAWSDTGLAVDHKVDLSQAIFKPLRTEEAIEYFDILLSTDANVVIVGEVNTAHTDIDVGKGLFWLNDITASQTRRLVPQSTDPLHSRTIKNQIPVELKGKDTQSYTDTETKLAELWAEVFYLKSVDIYMNFYEIGGNSIFGMKLLNRIHQEFRIEMNILEFMSHPTIVQLADYIDRGSHEVSAPLRIHASLESKEYYPASNIQKRLYALQLLDPENMSYHVVLAHRLKGKLDVTRLDQSVHMLMKRHESLRTSLKVMDGEVVQHIDSEDHLVSVLEYHQYTNGNWKEDIELWRQPFRLECAPLFRLGIFEVTELEHILVFDLHHVITDDISVQNLVRDLFMYYQGKGTLLPKVTYQYKDYVLTEERIDHPESVKEAWTKVLKKPLPKTIIPYDYSEVKDFFGQRKAFSLQSFVIGEMKRLTTRTETTSFMVFLTAFFIVLNKYTNQGDLIIGVPVSGRKHVEFENAVGAFIKTLPIRVSVSAEQSFEQLLNQVKSCVQQALAHQDYPLEGSMLDSFSSSDYYNHPWYNILFVQHYLGNVLSMDNEFEIEDLDFDNRTAKFDFSLESLIQEDECSFTVEYRTGLYSEDTIARFIDNYSYVIKTAIDNPGTPIGDIKFVNMIQANKPAGIEESLFDFEF